MFKSKNEREKRLEDPESHEFTVLTEGENFIDPEVEVLQGIHHLADNTLVYSREKERLNQTSAQCNINEEAFRDFQVDCCKSFQILRERAYVFINLLQLMIVSDIEEL